MDQAAEEDEFEVGSVVPDLHQHDFTSSTLFDFIKHPDLEKDIALILSIESKIMNDRRCSGKLYFLLTWQEEHKVAAA